MYFPRWFLEKVAVETNVSTYIPGSLEMYGGSSYSDIPEQTEGGDFEPERQVNIKNRVTAIKAMFARPDEIAPAIRGDHSPE